MFGELQCAVISPWWAWQGCTKKPESYPLTSFRVDYERSSTLLMFAKLRNEVRRPAVAGDFYPSGAQELESTVEALLSQAKKRRELSGLCGVVTPHAGYPYSGPIAGKAFSLLAHSNDGSNRIVLIGPPHYVPVRGIVAPSTRAFATLLGDIVVDVDAVESCEMPGSSRSTIPRIRPSMRSRSNCHFFRACHLPKVPP